MHKIIYRRNLLGHFLAIVFILHRNVAFIQRTVVFKLNGKEKGLKGEKPHIYIVRGKQLM